jgi:hypothetical protein
MLRCAVSLVIVALSVAQTDFGSVARAPERGSHAARVVDETTVRLAIIDSLADMPVAGALVGLADGSWHARSDGNGRVRFDGVPIGLRRVRVHAVGYESVDRLLAIRAPIAGDSAATVIDLARIPPLLDPQRTVATKPVHDADGGAFEMRRRMGIGHFFTWEDFNDQLGRTIAEVIAGRVAGVRNHSDTLHSTRATGSCPLDVYVDGQRVTGPFSLREINPFEVEAAEVYTATNIPPQFNTPVAKGPGQAGAGRTGPACGVLVLWLRKF